MGVTKPYIPYPLPGNSQAKDVPIGLFAHSFQMSLNVNAIWPAYVFELLSGVLTLVFAFRSSIESNDRDLQ
jgi:hypothetical protein